MKGGIAVQHKASSKVSSRGSVLVLVVGVLALMALIVLVYSTIGVGDRRSSAALVERTRIDETIKAMRDHFAATIANSAVAVLPQRITGNAVGTDSSTTARKSFDILTRKAVDIPWVDPEVRSIPTDTDAVSFGKQFPSPTGSAPAEPPHQATTGVWRKFQPTGGATQLWDPAGRTAPNRDVEPRTPTTPWLSVSEPIWIDAGQVRTNGDTTVINNPLDLAIESRDLLNISNFSPDGRFINKATLRGNIDAESGLDFGADGKLRTSGSMWLLDHDGNPTQVLQRPANGFAVLSQTANLFANPNIPNHWSSNQYGVHRPVSFVPQIGGRPLVPGDLRHPANLFADADGDGAFDSRWAEFVDASVPGDSVSVVPTPAGMRFVYAVKAVDLSGLVNVNTATSFARESSAMHPPGNTPSDIDLERILAMHDAYREFSDATMSTPGVYLNYPNPVEATRASNYQKYDNGTELGGNANLIGRSAFSAIVASRATGKVPDARIPGESYFVPDIQVANAADARFADTPVWLQNIVNSAADPRDGYMAVFARTQSYYFLGRSTGGVADTGTTSGSVALSLNLAFGMADESELRARHGLNDPSRQTRLELTLDGRSETTTPDDLRNFGPMRSNREGEVETLNLTGPAADDQFAMMTATSVRRNITTISGARPIRIDPSGVTRVGTIDPTNDSITPGPITSAEIVPDINSLLDDVYRNVSPSTVNTTRQQAMDRAVYAIFKGYADALLPDSTRGANPNNPSERMKVNVWDPAQPQGQVAVYGGRYSAANTPVGANAAEYALRTAAAMALNLIAERDPQIAVSGPGGYPAPTVAEGYQRTPRPVDDLVVATVLINEGGRPRLANDPAEVTGHPDAAYAAVNAADTSARKWMWWDLSTANTANTANEARPGLILQLDLNGEAVRTAAATPPPSPQRLYDTATMPDDGTARLSVPTPSAVPAITMFGVRPQPFLTQATTFLMFGNSEHITGNDMSAPWGDQEWLDADPNDPNSAQGPREGPGTINCTVSIANRDFLVEMLTFQLTNPFDVEVPLSKVVNGTAAADLGSLNPDEYRYYVEFNGRFFKIAEADVARNGTINGRTGVSLLPGESRTFYALSQSIEDIRDRWKGMRLPGSDVAIEQKVEDWIDAQLDMDASRLGGQASGIPVRAEAVRVVEFDPTLPTAVEIQPSPARVNFLSGAVDAPDKRVVRLWRQLRSDEDTGGTRRQQNDYLVDRLRDPESAARATLDCRPAPGKTTFDDTMEGVPDPAVDPDKYTDTRAAFTISASIRRPDDPRASENAESIPFGSFPAYCIESKKDFERNTNNIAELPPSPLRGGGVPDNRKWFDGYKRDPFSTDPLEPMIPFGSTSFSAAGVGTVDAQSVTGRHLVKSLASAASRRTTDTLASNGAGVNFNDVRIAIRTPRKVHVNPSSTTPKDYAFPPLRPADLLMPLAVTPTYLPVEGTGSSYTEKLNQRWTTLSESLGLATGYDWQTTGSAVPSTLTEAERNYYYQFGDTRDAAINATTGAAARTPGIVNRGHVVLNGYVPYNAPNPIGLFDQYGPNQAIANPTRGLGVPLAFNILSNFRTTSLGSITSMVPGLVNINTAPRSVLRALPLISPNWTPPGADPMAPRREWLTYATKDGSLGKLYDPAQEVWDLASVVTAYRDRTAVITRIDEATTPTRRTVDFSDYNTLAVTPNPANGYFSTGRRMATNISALRNDAGFLSIGELLAARITPYLASAPDTSPTATFAPRATTTKDKADLSIDRFGRMGDLGSASEVLAPQMNPATQPVLPSNPDPSTGLVTSMLVPLSGGTNPTPVEVPNSLEQQLSIANAVMNLVTVRSDVFCVWFVVEGYAPGDVEGLEYLDTIANATSPTAQPSDANYDAYARPMTPSVSRRYMMVVDRSNVTSEGQKPRILMFEEVPR